jgi:hypothetical protein
MLPLSNQDEDGVGVAIDFGRFLSTLAVFLPVKHNTHASELSPEELRTWAAAKQREKLKCKRGYCTRNTQVLMVLSTVVFHIYDVEGDGFIDAQELFAVCNGGGAGVDVGVVWIVHTVYHVGRAGVGC